MRKALTLTLAGAAVAVTLSAAPAMAACGTNLGDICSGSTVTTLTVLDTGSLSILPTATAAGSSVDVSGKRMITLSLNPTSVLDSRSSSPGWTASASAGTFTGTVSTNTIAGTGATFDVTGAPVLANSTLLATSALLTGATCPSTVTYATTPTSGGGALVTAPAGGITACTYTPSMTIDVTSAAADVYTGTVTQSVS